MNCKTLPPARLGHGILWILLFSAFGCSEQSEDAVIAELPQQIHGLALMESQSGAAAAGMIARLHGESVAPEESYIGMYSAEGLQAALFVSRFSSESEAASQLLAMATRLTEGSAGYGHHMTFDVGGTEVHSAFGNNQIHYFYARDNDVLWLAAPPIIARAALGELIGASLDEIPELGGPSAEAEEEDEAGE
jgi:hypothetical protein